MAKNRDFEDKQYTALGYTPLSPEKKALRQQVFQDQVKPLTVSDDLSVADLVENMAGMSIQARNIGQCAQVLKNMYTDKDRPRLKMEWENDKLTCLKTI